MHIVESNDGLWGLYTVEQTKGSNEVGGAMPGTVEVALEKDCESDLHSLAESTECNQQKQNAPKKN